MENGGLVLVVDFVDEVVLTVVVVLGDAKEAVVVVVVVLDVVFDDTENGGKGSEATTKALAVATDSRVDPRLKDMLQVPPPQ